MFDEQDNTSFWDTASNAVSDAWDSASGAASEAWNGASGAASGAWDSASSTVSGWFGGPQEEGPISVPVTPEQEAAAAAWVAESDRMNADPNHRSPYEQQQDRQAEAQRAYEKREAEKAAADPSNMWNAALDKYLKGEGPNPGPRNDYINKVERQREDASPNGPYSGQY